MPTNLLLAPNTPYSSGSWTAEGASTHTENYALGADGVSMTAWLDTDTDGTAVHSMLQNITVPSNTLPYIIYSYVKKTVGAITNAPALDIRVGAKNMAMEIDTTAGTIIARSGWTPDYSGILEGGGGYWLVWAGATNTSATTYTVRLSPALNAAADGNVAIGAGGSVVWWSPGFIQGTAPVFVPAASFTTPSATGTNLFRVPFTDTSTNTPTSWLWDFGDGTTSTSQNPTHSFTTGIYTVTLTATNAAGSSQATATITATANTATRGDWRCQGARYSAVYGHLAAISSPQTHRIVLADAGTDAAAWADSGVLTGAPGALVFGSTLWTACSDGYIRKLNTSTAALISSVNTYAATTNWLAINAEGVVIAPAARGQVSTISGTTVAATIPVLAHVDAAAYTTARYLYCFGNSKGAVVSVSAAGVLSKVAEFDAPHCRDIRRAKLMPDGTISVACKNWVVDFDITDPVAPVVDGATAYTSEVFSVADDTAHTAITHDTRLGGELPLYDATLSGTSYILTGPTPYVQVVT